MAFCVKTPGPGRMARVPLVARVLRCLCIVLPLAALSWPKSASAHPMVENVLDVEIAPDRISVIARVSMEEVLVAEAAGGAGISDEMRTQAARAHGAYVLRHLHLRADDRPLIGELVESIPPGGPAGSKLAAYRMEFALPAPAPKVVRVDQDLLSEFDTWSASCVVRIRQTDQPEFQTALLTRDKSVEFDCDWPAGAATRPAAGASTPSSLPTRTRSRFWPTVGDYFVLGVRHILTGYDHLLFVTALVLAAANLWDLIKVISAFTLAHTITLTLSVLNLVTLSERIVEPMIAASICFVALQNVLWPRQRSGWSRLAIAFAFGLFHGLGFAGGLKEAMSGMPGATLGAALGGFSAGVEAGHQVVVLPLFALMYSVRNYGATAAAQARARMTERILRYGSCAISIAGTWFLVKAIGLL
jgi:hydrogenase/urease accessory protein HupE